MNEKILSYILLGFTIHYSYDQKNEELLIKVSNDKVYATEIINIERLFVDDFNYLILSAIEKSIRRINKM